MALAVRSWQENTPEATQEQYKRDLKFFTNLRNTVRGVYSDTVDFSRYEAQIQKLIDRHVGTDEVVPITELVDILNQEALDAELERLDSTQSRADTIASRTQKHINERMDDDPALYKRFSTMLDEVIAEFMAKRIDEAEYLRRVTALMKDVVARGGSDLPVALRKRPEAAAFYHTSQSVFTAKLDDPEVANRLALAAALGVDAIIRQHVLHEGRPVIDWQNKSKVTGAVEIETGDFLLDEIRGREGLTLGIEDVNGLAREYLAVAKRRYG